MVLTERSARALLRALGFEKADSFTLKVCASKLEGVGTLPESRRNGVTEPIMKRLLATLIGSSNDGVTVKPDPVLERTAIAKKRRATVADDRECLQTDDEAAPGLTNNSKRKKGVQYHVFQKLLSGTRDKPVSKDDLVDHLKEVFPGRSLASMASTVAAFPTWLPARYPGYEVVRVEKALYYVRKLGEEK